MKHNEERIQTDRRGGERYNGANGERLERGVVLANGKLNGEN